MKNIIIENSNDLIIIDDEDYIKISKYKWWVARNSIYGKGIHLGYFASAIEAAKAYNIAALKYHKEFANLNKFDIEGI